MHIELNAAVPLLKILNIPLCFRLAGELVAYEISIMGTETVVVIERVLGLVV